MAKVRNAANTIRQGRIGENTWYVRDGIQVVRQRLQNSNYGEGARRSSLQQERRAKWGNLVNFYKAIKSWQPKAYESLKKGVTDYNAFMQLNANSTPIYLTRQMVEAGGAVLAAYQVAKGTLPSVTLTESSDIDKQHPLSDIKATVVIEGSLSFGTFSANIVQQNEHFEDGDNIAYVSLWQEGTSSSVPRIYSRYQEFTLDVNSSKTLGAMGIDWLLTENNKLLFCPSYQTIKDNNGGVVIHTRRSNGVLMTSTQYVWTRVAPSADFTNDAAKAAAIASYGVDSDVPLAPGA